MYEKYIKRVLGFLLSLLGIIILSPILLIICLAIKIDSKGPIIFKQKRVGKNKKYFSIYKFRTMKSETPKEMPTHLLNNPDAFITKVGKFLRKTSLDEVPQLFNILKGDMAVIGPRPALWNQYDLIAERDKYGVNEAQPGLTGLAQISGRDELEIPVKAQIDGKYTSNISFMMDVKCFVGTILSIVKSDGVVEGGTGTKKKADDE
ncbi:sugar transferase [Tetragenococcus halophilus]|uniref:sugar transferase n=1 Tax=Tetragenococcus halophilus TaxID=51669 RepID=UPI000CA759B0|nr:sugar transferase [Tetragenococcus halophilus]GBD72069.1 putative polyprenyl-phosphate--hexose-phosphate transferase [Tetragenococcus halophilus subsp. halophilus]GBD74525.1 putative polyprenyl-phosphate--hexose-phosphate transferase [Tetragenococcus halophilus subsp. halophilus]GEQ37763.1 sugar transferase [Tetragenococcus halophilus]GEQ40038.1 sugar transferase [Tetragenococcus halophilus]GEQ42140.1 sugar transferase [Tetragenococcus halophilus]